MMEIAGRRGDALIARHQQLRGSYRTIKARVDVFGRGERVGIWSPNNPQGVVTQFATARIGLVLVNINTVCQMAEVE